jgi:DNA-binding CsgD family transcriptional regulator
MPTSANQSAPDVVARDLVALLHRLGLAVVVRTPESASILASSPSAEELMLAATPGKISVALAKIAGTSMRVEALQIAPDHTVVSLTPRQVQVADLLQDGLRNHEISERLGISPHTVRRHVEEILRRLGVANRTQAAADLRRRRRGTGPKR